jgi:hypothetical protein
VPKYRYGAPKSKIIPAFIRVPGQELGTRLSLSFWGEDWGSGGSPYPLPRPRSYLFPFIWSTGILPVTHRLEACAPD